jgi:hypothetical protein
MKEREKGIAEAGLPTAAPGPVCEARYLFQGMGATSREAKT